MGVKGWGTVGPDVDVAEGVHVGGAQRRPLVDGGRERVAVGRVDGDGLRGVRGCHGMVVVVWVGTDDGLEREGLGVGMVTGYASLARDHGGGADLGGEWEKGV